VKYRKNNEEAEAFQMTKARRVSNADWPEWLHQAWQLERETPGALFPTEEGASYGTLSLGTPEGQYVISWGDWIVRDAEGKLSRVKCDKFKITHKQ